MTRNRLFKTLGLSVISCALISGAPKFARAQDAETYYIGNIEAIVQAKCIACHVSGGQAGSTSLRFTGSSSNNHTVFESYVNSPLPGARATTVLNKISGQAGHGGGTQVSQGSSDYLKFSEYMELLSAEAAPEVGTPGAPTNVSAIAGDGSATVSFSPPTDNGGADISVYTARGTPGGLQGTCSFSPCQVEGLSNGTAYTFTVTATNEAGEGAPSSASNSVTPASSAIFRVALEEPVEAETHTGVGNLRGWAVSSSGINKIEVFIDGAYAFDAPYGGNRGDVGGAFPEVEGSSESGFSLAFNYSDLSVGPHIISVIAHEDGGQTKESSASFNVVKFASNFISGSGAVSLNDGSCALNEDEISIDNARVADNLYNLLLKWRTSEQGFEIVEIR